MPPPPLAVFDAEGDAYSLDSWREWSGSADNATATGAVLFATTCVLSVLAMGAMSVCAYSCLGRPRAARARVFDDDDAIHEEGHSEPERPPPLAPPPLVKVVNHPDGSVVLAMRPRGAAAPVQ